jgi:hypothetical protein
MRTDPSTFSFLRSCYCVVRHELTTAWEHKEALFQLGKIELIFAAEISFGCLYLDLSRMVLSSFSTACLRLEATRPSPT